MANYYTGVGSRETPDNILFEMRRIAEKMRHMGYTLRSGAAPGADTAFEIGAGSDTEIYLPWNGFNGHDDKDGTHINAKTMWNIRRAYQIAELHHPRWEYLKDSHKALHARNTYQVLGFELNNPSTVLICWSKPLGTGVSGGTATAVSIAKHYGVPVYNLYFEEELNQIHRILGIF